VNTDAVVVIATYNEAETIGWLLDTLRQYHVIVVDSDSPDGTAAIAEDHPNAFVILQQYGPIAGAYLNGFGWALAEGCEYVVQMDAGGTHDPVLVPAMLASARRMRADLLIGSRFTHWPGQFSYRMVISLGAAALMRAKGVPVRDATSGFRIWRADVLQQAIARDVTARGFAFQLELLWNAHRVGARIGEYPIPYRLTNSSFKPAMVWEALRIVRGLT
jgi:glycosyltransferase involved in cell wall biosynthesis